MPQKIKILNKNILLLLKQFAIKEIWASPVQESSAYLPLLSTLIPWPKIFYTTSKLHPSTRILAPTHH